METEHGSVSPPPARAPAGLSTQEAQERLRQFGANTVAEERSQPPFVLLQKFWAPIPWMLEATAALELALGKWVAKKFETPLRIVHVIENAYVRVGPAEGINVEPIAQAWREAGQKVLDEASAQARGAGVETETALLEEVGRVSEMVVEEAKRWNADLIVIGTHGRRGLQHLLLGSVAEGVLCIAPVPVLAVRLGASES